MAHCDSHAVCMPKEAAQILSAVWHKSGLLVPQGLYDPTHLNHPCVVWAEHSNSNYGWLAQLGLALCEEYTHRYGKTHASEAVVCIAEEPPSTVVHGPLTPFALAMPTQYMIGGNGVASYRKYYESKRETMHLFRYSKRQQPAWLTPDNTKTKNTMKQPTNEVLSALPLATLAAVYNLLMSKINPSAKPIKKFPSKDKGLARLEDLSMVNDPELRECLVELKLMEPDQPKKKAAKKGAKKGAKKTAKKATSAEPKKLLGRSKFSLEHKIFKAQEDNPRREGSKGYKTWDLIEDGMTIEDFLEVGGEYVHLVYDYGRGAVDIKN